MKHSNPPEPQGNDLRFFDDKIKSLEESIQELKQLKIHRNTFTPISHLNNEILAFIFSLLSSSVFSISSRPFAAPFCISHVCHRWREISLNLPHLWSHIDFTDLTLASTAKMLARAKTAPLYLEADITRWEWEQIDAFLKLLNAHVSQTRHLKICGPPPSLRQVVKRLVSSHSSAHNLEFLSLSHKSSSYNRASIPVNLFNRTTPKLTSLELENCNIDWQSPILKGLRTLKILGSSEGARPELRVWLNALDQMSQLETLILESATPRASPTPLTLDSWRIITLPSLTKFDITASAADCVLALAHLAMPALIWLHVNAKSHEKEGGDMRLLIPYVSRNVCMLQGTEPLRSILIDSEGNRAEVLAWTMPDADFKFCHLNTIVPARLTFTATGSNWCSGVDTAIFEAFLTLLPTNFLSSLTTRNDAELNTKFWVTHAPRWPLLERASLVTGSFFQFMHMLLEDGPPDGPRLPRLTKLILVDVRVTMGMTDNLSKVLIQRVEQGVPLEVLDLSMSFADDGEIHLLREIVVDVKEPLVARENRVLKGTRIRQRAGSLTMIVVRDYNPYEIV